MVANEIWDLLVVLRYEKDMMIIGGESDPVNIDPNSGVFHRIQEKKGHRLTVAVCMLQSLKNVLQSFTRSRFCVAGSLT